MQINTGRIAANGVRLPVIPILIITILAVTACVPQPEDCSREDAFCVGLVTALDGVEDHGLNQVTWETLQNIETQAQVARLDNIETVDARDWQKNITFFADNHYDVIVTVGTNIGETMVAVAAEYPGISFIGVDQEFDEVYKNIATISFPQDQAGFLAGLLAAMVSTSGRVGAVCETSGIDVVWQYCEGFRAGALYEKDDIDITVVYRDSGERDKTFNDPVWGQEQVLSLIETGVDTVTGFGGNTAQGAFLKASEEGILVIGSEEDLYYRLPDVQPWLVTSIIKDPGMELSTLVLLVSQGEPISGPRAGQISYAPFRTSQFETAMEIKINMDDALQGIRNGEIEIDLPEKE
jgi:basic membrane protein A